MNPTNPEHKRLLSTVFEVSEAVEAPGEELKDDELQQEQRLPHAAVLRHIAVGLISSFLHPALKAASKSRGSSRPQSASAAESKLALDSNPYSSSYNPLEREPSNRSMNELEDTANLTPRNSFANRNSSFAERLSFRSRPSSASTSPSEAAEKLRSKYIRAHVIERFLEERKLHSTATVEQKVVYKNLLASPLIAILEYRLSLKEAIKSATKAKDVYVNHVRSSGLLESEKSLVDSEFAMHCNDTTPEQGSSITYYFGTQGDYEEDANTWYCNVIAYAYMQLGSDIRNTAARDHAHQVIKTGGRQRPQSATR